jgi:DNA-binding CsgD family transcriptional regulator
MAVRTEPGTALTDRELMIVRLVSMGRSNGEIANQLFISIRTVHTHLHHAYVKTGTSNRVQISQWLWGVSE